MHKPRPIQNDGKGELLAGNTRRPGVRPPGPKPFPRNWKNRNGKGPSRGSRGGPPDSGTDPPDSSQNDEAAHYKRRLECHQYGTGM